MTKRYTIVKRNPRTARCDACRATLPRLAVYRTPVNAKACRPCAVADYAR